MNNLPTPLPRHQYPPHIKLFAAAVAVCLVYSLFLLPQYIGASIKLRNAETAFNEGNYVQAAAEYQYVLSSIPSSTKAKIGYAEAVFSSGNSENYQAGLEALRGITLTSESWTRLSKVMPTEYQQFFTDVH